MNARPTPYSLWRDPYAPAEPAARRFLRLAIVVAVHVAAVGAFVGLAANPEMRQATQDLMVRLIEPPRPEPQVAPPRPQPAMPQTPRRAAPPPPVMTAAAEAPATPSFAVAPQPAAPPRIEAAPVPTAVTAARFDADYLRNPKPVYPVFSRRLGEEGKVQLRVRVGADGAALEVVVRQSSGYPRLDAAAREAVMQWRFVPAKQGETAVESWVGVPIVFALEH